MWCSSSTNSYLEQSKLSYPLSPTHFHGFIQLMFHRTTPIRFRLIPAVLLSITEFTKHISPCLQRKLSHPNIVNTTQVLAVCDRTIFLLVCTLYDNFVTFFFGLINASNRSELCSSFLHLVGSKHFLCVASSPWEDRSDSRQICSFGLGCLQGVDGLWGYDVEGSVSTTDIMWNLRVEYPNMTDHTK